MGFYLGPNRTH